MMITLVTAMLASTVQAAPVQAAPSSNLQTLATGRFDLAEPLPRVQARLDTATDKAVASMNWMFRSIARPRLRANLVVCEHLQTWLTPHSFRVSCDGHSVSTYPVGRPGTVLDDEGDPMRARVILEDPGLRVVLDSIKATHTTRYAWRSDGLDLSVKLTSSYWDEPLRYAVSYRRGL